MTFLQPSTVYETTVSDESLSTASDSTDTSVITVKENNPSQEVDSSSSLTLLTALSDDPANIDYILTPIQPVEPAPIQPVEPVIGLTTDKQRQREEDHNLTLNELLGLSLYEEHVNTPLQTLDGQYINQPRHFLPLIQEARKLAEKIKAEEEALKISSQFWKG